MPLLPYVGVNCWVVKRSAPTTVRRLEAELAPMACRTLLPVLLPTACEVADVPALDADLSTAPTARPLTSVAITASKITSRQNKLSRNGATTRTKGFDADNLSPGAQPDWRSGGR